MSGEAPWKLLLVHALSPVGGGGEESLFTLVKRLDKKRFHPVLLLTSQGPALEKLRSLGVEVVKAEFPSWRRDPLGFVLSYWRLGWLIGSKDIRLVHVNHQGLLGFIPLVCRLLRVPCLCHVRSLLLTRSLKGRALWMWHLLDGVVAVSEAGRRAIIAAGISPEKVSVCHSGVDLEEFAPRVRGQKIRQELGLGPRIPVVGLVGRLVPWKGIEEFLEASAIIARQLPEVRFVVIGDHASPEYLARLKAQAGELGITSRVIFAGFRSDMPQVMAALDIVAVPSHVETFPRVVMEAMAAGKPVVGTRVGGTPEQIEPGVNGLLVNPQDAPALAQALVRLLKDQEEAKAMGEAGRRMAEERFSLRKHVLEMERIYSRWLHG